jgi:hypothetical protein
MITFFSQKNFFFAFVCFLWLYEVNIKVKSIKVHSSKFIVLKNLYNEPEMGGNDCNPGTFSNSFVILVVFVKQGSKPMNFSFMVGLK